MILDIIAIVFAVIIISTLKIINDKKHEENRILAIKNTKDSINKKLDRVIEIVGQKYQKLNNIGNNQNE